MNEENVIQMNKEVEFPKTTQIDKYTPIGDCVLITANYKKGEKKKDLSEEVEKFRNYYNIQTVIAVGTGVEAKHLIKPGDILQIDIEAVMDKFFDYVAYADTTEFEDDESPKTIYLRIPTYLVRGKVKISERELTEGEKKVYLQSINSGILEDK